MKEKLATVMVIDGGGRGAALIDTYAQSDHVGSLLAVPGNDLMYLNTHKPVETFPDIRTTSVDAIVQLASERNVTLVDVAQDNALAVGIADVLRSRGIATLGPSRQAAQIEWDKAYARQFGTLHGLNQPAYSIWSSPERATAYLENAPDEPRFIKAAGLAEGKGALPAKIRKEAINGVREMGRFGEAGKVFLIESWISGDDQQGEEFSGFALSDSNTHQVIAFAQDHKRALTFDEGGNTGGMGCVSAPLVATQEIRSQVGVIFDRTFTGFQKEGRPYQGILYLGGMVVRENGVNRVYVVEFNSRLGDPEAQGILSGVTNDWFEIAMETAEGRFQQEVRTDRKTRVVVTGAARGYPGDYSSVKGKQIFGLRDAMRVEGVTLYGAGVKEVDGKHYAVGGRLFYLVGEGETVIEARQKAYAAMSLVTVDGNNLHYRLDIGWRDAERLRKD